MKKDLRSTFSRVAAYPAKRAVALRLCAVAGAFATICGCSLLSTGNETHPWSANGVLALSRPVPEVGVKPLPRAQSMLGFMPTTHTQEAASVTISRTSNMLELSGAGDSGPRTFPIEGAQNLPVGTYSVLLKQQDPLWYAPDRYFTSRELDIPGQGEKERFRRGALGSHALFLSGETPIHAGPLWSEEIGGVRIEPTAMQALFAALQVGSRVEVR